MQVDQKLLFSIIIFNRSYMQICHIVSWLSATSLAKQEVNSNVEQHVCRAVTLAIVLPPNPL